MNTHLVSFIVPVYNEEAHLDECINSIVSQTWRNIEVILIDDGSTDSSYLKCLDWAGRDSRIRTLAKKNGGAASARNAGLAIATGDLLCFVDSDDFIDAEMVAEMIQILDGCPGCGLVISRAYCYYDGVGDKLLDCFPFYQSYDEKYIPEEQYLKDIISWQIENFACTKLIRKEYSHLVFSEGRSNEDFMYIFQNAMNNHLSNNKFPWVGVADLPYYHYRQHESQFPNLEYDIISHKKEVYKICENSDFQLSALQSYFDSIMIFFRQNLARKNYRKDIHEIMTVYSQFKRIDFSSLKTKSKKEKIIIFLNKHFSITYVLFVKIGYCFKKCVWKAKKLFYTYREGYRGTYRERYFTKH